MDPTREPENDFDVESGALDLEDHNRPQDEYWSQGSLKKSVTDLENYLVNSMAKVHRWAPFELKTLKAGRL